ncbi:uncharacterized protein V1516DRAFT_668173 [Lipomyces oligophaga]|uniref:uncharacterized protein n=1 Tax=Lipomyces oligophaga TaxID=45792 RepID=UPI0034CF538F
MICSNGIIRRFWLLSLNRHTTTPRLRRSRPCSAVLERSCLDFIVNELSIEPCRAFSSATIVERNRNRRENKFRDSDNTITDDENTSDSNEVNRRSSDSSPHEGTSTKEPEAISETSQINTDQAENSENSSVPDLSKDMDSKEISISALDNSSEPNEQEVYNFEIKLPLDKKNQLLSSRARFGGGFPKSLRSRGRASSESELSELIDSHGYFPYDKLDYFQKYNIILYDDLVQHNSHLKVLDKAAIEQLVDIEGGFSDKGYYIDKAIYDRIYFNALNALDADSKRTDDSWLLSSRNKIDLCASEGQSMQYLDAIVEQVARDISGDIVRLEDADLERIVSKNSPFRNASHEGRCQYDFRNSNVYSSRISLFDSESVVETSRVAEEDEAEEDEEDEEDEAEYDDERGKDDDSFDISDLGINIEELLKRSTLREDMVAGFKEKLESQAELIEKTEEVLYIGDKDVKQYASTLVQCILACVTAKHSLENFQPRQGRRPIIVHFKYFDEMANSKCGKNIIPALLNAFTDESNVLFPVIFIATLSSNYKIERANPIPMEPTMLRMAIPNSKLTFNGRSDQDVARESRILNARYLDIYLSRTLPRFEKSEDSEEVPYFRILDLENSWFDEPLSDDNSLSHQFFSAGAMPTIDMMRLIYSIKGLMLRDKHKRVSPEMLEYAIQTLRVPSSKDRKSDQDDSKESAHAKILRTAGDRPKATATKTKAEIDAELASKLDLTTMEKSLFHLVVNPEDITSQFEDVIAPTETLEGMQDSIMLELEMPEEFTFGILKDHHLTGVLLYGPPGTGKTLLARSFAKAGKARMIQISPADILEKYVGESEKNIVALFSLAKKLSPCVIFLDEVDALLASRSSGFSVTSRYRESINQFMSEWDGVRGSRVLLFGATNRPFDIDDAVLRRFPRRLLVDLPTRENRKDIFILHLKDEIVDTAEITFNELASRTEYYSGSDIKNVCLVAAFQAIKERRNLRDQFKQGTGVLSGQPAKRVLCRRHFEHALNQIQPSLSDANDMNSLTQIREWHRKFGMFKKRRNVSWGFKGPEPEIKPEVRI